MLSSSGEWTRSPARRRALHALERVPGKAEIVRGRVVRMSPASAAHGHAVLAICLSLRRYQETTGVGQAFGDNVGFLVDLPNRWSFCPDAAYHLGPWTGPAFLDRAPAFAVEVRSKDEYGPAAERRLARKRAEYFAAGTLVVWDVDVLRDESVRVFLASAPDDSRIYRRGEVAEAEPALPGWSLAVDALFIR